MSSAFNVKDIRVKVIPPEVANEFMRKVHYSGSYVRNSRVHFGAFKEGTLRGVMSFGNSTNKKLIIPLVSNTKWNGFIELNRMAFDDELPRNSESRALSVAFRLLKKNAPHIKWIVTYADATQCGDGTIYRATGFKLTGIKKNTSMVRLPDGTITHRMNFQKRCSPTIWKKWNPKNLTTTAIIKQIGAETLDGFQIRYVYFLDKDVEKDLSVPILPYSALKEKGASMYLGEKLRL